jgi:hypothetical protein
MPQLKEDEWPKNHQPTTTEQEHLKDKDDSARTEGGSDEYPPKLPPEALPTKD